MRTGRHIIIYGALIVGSLIFVWPFLWMAATSAKLDRELFGDRIRLFPQAPLPRAYSPYIDERFFADVQGPRLGESLAIIERRLASESVDWPLGLDRALVLKQTARGLYKKLMTLLPRDTWLAPPDELDRVLTASIRPEMTSEVLLQLRRAFCIGELRVRSYDLKEDLLVEAGRVASGWAVTGPAKAELLQSDKPGPPFAELRYDFSNGDSLALEQIFTTSFPLESLHRIQLSLRYDDTWHALTLFVEKQGKLFRAARALPSADYNWVVDTWQEPGPDDRPTKIQTWTLLREVDHGPQYLNRPNTMKLRLALERSNATSAWWAKISRNYRLTLDHIPFWRYVSTSLFLIILNLIGTLLSCSLVAYSFARLQWPGRGVAFALMLATMMVPPQVTMIPQFLIMQRLGWYNTLNPLWIASFVAPAFYVFLLRQFLKGIPRDLEDAARLDGCGFLRIYWHIMLPLVRPTLAAIAIFTFMSTWNEFMGPLIYLSDQRLYPLSFGLYAFQVDVAQAGTSAGMGMMMAGSLLMTLPVIAIFFFAQRYFLQGVTLTGMKG